ncbi:MAG: hypothetical protein WAK01_01800 [Methylocystis sp.]
MTESDQAFTLLEDGDEFALSAGAGGFRLRNKSEGTCAELQDEDAERFRADYEELRTRSPEWGPDQVLAQLWDQGGYGWLAKEEGEAS